jgi:UDPglucose 6-dehydrogenase
MTNNASASGKKSNTAADGRPAPVISVIGTGYLGATHAAAMAEMGFETIGVDIDPSKLAALSAGEVPFYEPGLPELITKHVTSGKLRFTADLPAAVAAADVHFVCVGTPQRAGSHAANLSYVESAVRGVAENLTHPGLIIGKSTVPVGTAARLRTLVAEFAPAGLDPELVWNPEFLREGKAVEDTLHPDRLVWGGASPAADAVIREVYAAPISEGTPVIATDLATAELVKVSANAFLATKISFINAISERSPARTSTRSPTRSATTPASAGSSSTPVSASAAAACPRTSAPSCTARTSSTPAASSGSCSRSTRSTWASGSGSSTWRSSRRTAPSSTVEWA